MKQGIKLWEGEIPLYTDDCDTPIMHYYPAENKRGNGAVIIFPGGGYTKRVYHEGEPYALRLNEMGISAFVVDYRVYPAIFPIPLLDARRAVRLVRARAEEFGIDPCKIAVMGSSAGGHLAALCSTYKGTVDGEGIDRFDDVDCMPNAQILCYPVTDIASHKDSYDHLLGRSVSEYESVTPTLLADEATPPAFIWHTSTDRVVNVCGSYRYACRLSELGVLCEMHIYPIGGHGAGLGLGLCGGEPIQYLQCWQENLEAWLKLNGWINK